MNNARKFLIQRTLGMYVYLDIVCFRLREVTGRGVRP